MGPTAGSRNGAAGVPVDGAPAGARTGIGANSSAPTGAVASARQLVKVYGEGEAQVRALDGVDVDLGRGRFTAILGPSGSGKSTLMHCLAALDTPTSGSVVLDGVEVAGLRDRALTALRRDRVGFVFQSFNLVPTLTARENITLPLDIAGRPLDRDWFDLVVDTVGLRNRLHHRPNQLSGGQQQRVACARAVISRPAIVFADEPTGNLDSRAGAEILTFLRRSVDEFGQSTVIVTHDPVAAGYADRALFLADGRIVDEMTRPTAQAVLERLKSFDGRGPADARSPADGHRSTHSHSSTDAGRWL
jgi:putative ABC transport system ATP-binding protein